LTSSMSRIYLGTTGMPVGLFSMIRNRFREKRASILFISSISVFVLCLLAGWISYILAGHRLIEILYQSGSTEFLNRVIEEQGLHPLEFYFTKIDSLFYSLAAFYSVLGIICSIWLLGISLFAKDNVFKKYLFVYFLFGVLLFFVRLTRVAQHYNILENVFFGISLAPNIYRVLIPFLTFLLKKAVPALSWLNSASIWNFIFVLSAFPLFHKYLEKWFERKTCFLITVILIYLLPVSFGYDYPSDFFELMVFITGYMLIRDRKDSFLYLLIFLASFDRPTSIFLAIAYFISNVERKNFLNISVKSFTYFICWLIPVIGLIVARGVRPYRCNIIMVAKEIEGIGSSLLLRSHTFFDFLFFLFPLLFIYAIFKQEKECRFLRRNIMTVAIIFLVGSIIGSIHEVRIFYPILPILVPLAFYPLFGNQNERINPINVKQI